MTRNAVNQALKCVRMVSRCLTIGGLTSLSGYKPVRSQRSAISHSLAHARKPLRRRSITALLLAALAGYAAAEPAVSQPRTGWDSNPRYPCGYTGFRDRPFQPL